MATAYRTPTAEFLEYRRNSYVERRCKPKPVLAPVWDRAAAKVLQLPAAPDLGAGGEVVQEQPRREDYKRANIRDTLREDPTVIAEDASVRRTDLLQQPTFDCVALAIDLAESIRAENSVEKAIAHQMAVAHEMSMRMANNALRYTEGFRPDNVEANRCASTVVKLMAAFQNGALTLQRLRNGGSQTVTVQHVNVAAGGQALVGNVSTPGGSRGG